jgi:hypothetical protein
VDGTGYGIRDQNRADHLCAGLVDLFEQSLAKELRIGKDATGQRQRPLRGWRAKSGGDGGDLLGQRRGRRVDNSY